MNDETEKSAGLDAAPNRGPRREPPTLEGLALESETIASVPPGSAAPDPTPNPAKPLTSVSWPGPIALAALLLGGVALFYALNPAVPPVASPEPMRALGQRLDVLEARLAAQEARPVPVLPVPVLPAPVLPAPTDLTPLTGRVDAVEKAAAEARNLAARAIEQAGPQPVPPPQPGVDLGPLDQRLSRLESRLDSDIAALHATLAAARTDVRAPQSPDLAGLAPQNAAVLAVVATSLRQQIDLGAPFARETRALEKLGADPVRLSKLMPLSATGAPSTARLAQEFSGLSAAMLRAGHPVQTDGDLMDRLARSAASLVRVRPVGDIVGEDAPALVSRMEASLRRGDVAEALAAFDRLPDDIKAPARDWETRARQRVAAVVAARSLLDDALDTLARK